MSADKSKLKPPSELFEDVVRSSGSLRITCELCGREHFASLGNGDYEPGEYESLVERQTKEPDKYIEHDDYVSWGHINGKQAVIGCPCNELYRFEAFIWNHKELIMEYLTRRIKGEVNEVAQWYKMARAAKKAVEQSQPERRPGRVFDL